MSSTRDYKHIKYLQHTSTDSHPRGTISVMRVPQHTPPVSHAHTSAGRLLSSLKAGEGDPHVPGARRPAPLGSVPGPAAGVGRRSSSGAGSAPRWLLQLPPAFLPRDPAAGQGPGTRSPRPPPRRGRSRSAGLGSPLPYTADPFAPVPGSQARVGGVGRLGRRGSPGSENGERWAGTRGWGGMEGEGREAEGGGGRGWK